MDDDATLLRRYAEEESEAAFAELVERHLGLVYGAALRQLDGAAHRAQDVTQTVFVDLARHAVSLSRRSEIIGWLYTSTHYAAAKLKRTEQRRQIREQEAHTMHELLSDASASIDWNRLRPVLDEVMHELSNADREVILTRFFQGRRFSEVGQKLGVNEDAARMRAERALEKLRVLLARRQITSTTAALGLILAHQPAVAIPPSLAATVTSAALTGATGAGAGATTATASFMSMTTGILSVVALGAIGSAIYETNQVKRAESVTAAIVRDRDALRSQLREVQQHVSRSDQRATDLQGQVDALHASKTPPPSTSIVAVTTSANGLTRTRQAEEEDALKRAAEEVAQRKTARIQQLDRDYHTLYRQLGLTPAQITQFKTLVRENFDRRDELGKLAAAQGLKPGDPAMQGLFTQADVDFRTKMQNAFGEAAWQAMQHFNETALLRNVVGNLAGSLLYTDAPITPAQASEIVEIMWNNMHTAQGKLDASAEKIDALMTQARAVLSSVQLEALRQSIKVGEGKAREASPERQAVGY